MHARILNILLRMFPNCSIYVKRYLFNVYFSDLYCLSFWFDSSQTAIKPITIAYNYSLDGY